MAYPKPLSEKRIQKMYDDANINEAQSEFLHKFFKAAANLYGVVTAGELWEVYKEYSEMAETPKLKRQTLIDFSAIARREEHSYRVYELNEIYSGEAQRDLERMIVNRELLFTGYGGFGGVYKIYELAFGKTCYVPENLLDYVKPVMTSEQKELLKYLGKLKITASTSTTSYGKTVSCPDKGKCLKDAYSYMETEKDQIHYLQEYSGKNNKIHAKEQLEKFLEEVKAPVSERLMRKFLGLAQRAVYKPPELVSDILDDISEVGVELTERKYNELLGLLVNVHNTTHLFANKGWTPKDLQRKSVPVRMPLMSFGPGIRKAIEEGTMDGEELVRKLAELGIPVIGPQ